MKNKFSLLAAATLGLTGCASQQQMVDEMQSDAVHTAQNRVRRERHAQRRSTMRKR